jgi:hypothetical protein
MRRKIRINDKRREIYRAIEVFGVLEGRRGAHFALWELEGMYMAFNSHLT